MIKVFSTTYDLGHFIQSLVSKSICKIIQNIVFGSDQSYMQFHRMHEHFTKKVTSSSSCQRICF